MARKTKQERQRLQEYAETLYTTTSMTQREIAERVGVSEKTIGKWKDDEKWDAKRAAITISKEQELKRLFAQLNELNTFITNKPEGHRFASSKEADALKKITSAIKDLETDLGITDTVNVCMKLLKWIRTEDYEASVKFNQLADRYIKTLLS